MHLPGGPRRAWLGCGAGVGSESPTPGSAQNPARAGERGREERREEGERGRRREEGGRKGGSTSCDPFPCSFKRPQAAKRPQSQLRALGKARAGGAGGGKAVRVPPSAPSRGRTPEVSTAPRTGGKGKGGGEGGGKAGGGSSQHPGAKQQAASTKQQERKRTFFKKQKINKANPT